MRHTLSGLYVSATYPSARPLSFGSIVKSFKEGMHPTITASSDHNLLAVDVSRLACMSRVLSSAGPPADLQSVSKQGTMQVH